MDLATKGKQPEPQRRIRLTLQWLVFLDRWGNFVIVDPGQNKPLWLDESHRPPTMYLAATDAEMKAATEEMLHRYTRTTRVTAEHLRLVDRVEAALEQHFERKRREAKRAA